MDRINGLAELVFTSLQMTGDSSPYIDPKNASANDTLANLDSVELLVDASRQQWFASAIEMGDEFLS